MRARGERKETAAQFTRIQAAGGSTWYQCGRTVFGIAGLRQEESLTAEETWQIEAGSYLFLGENLKAEESGQFFADAMRLIKSCGGRLLFGWICNPSAPLGQWQYQLLLWERGGEDAHSFLTGREFDWQRYALFLPGGSRLVLEDEAALRLKMGEKRHWLRTPGLTLGGEGEPRLWLTGENAGVWEIDFVLPEQEEVFAQIDAGVRYYSMSEGQPYSATAALFYPEQEIHLRGQLDFAKAPEEGMRFFFDESASFEFPCEIPTLYGRKVYARMQFPAGGAAVKSREEERPGLIFARGIRWFTSEAGKPGAACEYYLTYTGKFKLRMEETDAANDDRILCGRMGTEYLACGDDGFLTLRFYPGNPAYCGMAGGESGLCGMAGGESGSCGMADGESGLDGPAEGKTGLTGLATTAWISFGAEEQTVDYYSTAAQTALYAVQEKTSEFLDYLELPVAQLQGERAVPFLPVKRLAEKTVNEELLLGMELSGVLPTRAKILLNRENAIAGSRSGEQTAATPQGFLVGVTGNAWNWIKIASNAEGGSPDSVFAGISEELRMKFHDSRLFLAMADAAAIGAQLQQWKLDFAVGDWRFLVDEEHFRSGREDQSNTAIIFKYAKDKSIDELMQETNFEGEAVAGNIRQIYQSAAAHVYDRDGNVLADYRNFYEMTHDRAFSGVLVLNCPLSVSQMPEELKLLLAGLKEDALYAHHMGVHANDLTVKDGVPVMKRSSYFGLVDYQDNGVLVNENTDSKDYDFLTKRVLLEIRNSVIVKFAAEAEVLINRLFDARAEAVTGEAGNCLVLDGSYQNCGGVGQYVFALRQNTVFALRGSMLENVEITAVRMKAGETDGMLTGSFGLTGKLRFWRNAACDILAYGSCPDTGEDGYLAFDNLAIDMSIKQAGTGAKHFTVRYETLTLDETQSILRRGSMPTCLPAHPQALMRYNLSEGAPKAFGYRSITCPVEQGEIKSQWYGLSFVIPLGSLGGNSAVAALELKLLCAWGMPEEGKEEPPVFVGILLPGLGADGITLSLQGILKLDFKSVELLVYHTEEKTDYQLCFRNFTLSALGMSFPPGKNNIYLFGEDGSRLGWYAAYQKEGKNGDDKRKSDDFRSRTGDGQSDRGV